MTKRRDGGIIGAGINNTEGNTMTPCEKLGYKVGDRFEVLEGSLRIHKGEIVTLSEDDGTECPYFKSQQYENGIKLHSVRPLKPEWDGTGLPSVGTECTAALHGGAHEFDIRVTYSVKEVVCGEIINPAHGFKSGTIYPFDTSIYSFTPLHTERDKAVDDMTSVSGIFNSQAEKLYDAGYRKP